MFRRISLSLTFWLFCGFVASALAQTIPRDIRLQLLEAVVQIVPLDVDSGELVPWSGSGTIISRQGHILTNFHVIGDLDTRTYYEWHAVFVTDPAFTDQPPQLAYWARYVASDPTHDLAVLSIAEYADETPVPPETVFPAVSVGDSNQMLPGDGLVIVGYPGISGSTITFTSGTMSGWIGEDFETGGKQWIKTDAKIAYGNSGGAAFDLAGNLIGVPTAGRTVQYEDLDVEEQAYVRPISLAWALIGPHVPTVQRASPPEPTQPVAQPSLPAARAQDTSEDPGAPSGAFGPIGLGALVSARLAAASTDALTYHGYSVTVPADAERVIVAVDGRGSDVDLAVNDGAPIMEYETVDHLDASAEPNPRWVVEDPSDVVYIDVINLLNQPSDYTLLVTVEEGSAATDSAADPAAVDTVNPSAPADPSPGAATTIVPVTTSGAMGSLRPGESAQGRLTGTDDAASYHTFEISVPPGVATVTVRMIADADLDMAARVGGAIDTYTDDGNWDHRDVSTRPSAEFSISAPGSTIYVDVFNALGAGVSGAYTLEVR